MDALTMLLDVVPGMALPMIVAGTADETSVDVTEMVTLMRDRGHPDAGRVAAMLTGVLARRGQRVFAGRVTGRGV